LPLAIALAGAYIWRTNRTFAQYRRMYLERRRATLVADYVNSLRLGGYARTAYTTWSLSYEQLSSRARLLLVLLAFLHREGISENIFRRAALNAQTYVPEVPPTDAAVNCQRDVTEYLGLFLDESGLWNDILFLSVMTEVASLSLIEYDKENQVYVMHSLVQDWTRAVAPGRKMGLRCTSFLLALSVDRRQRPEDLAHHRAIELHVNEVLSQNPLANSNDAWQFALVYHNLRHLSKSEALETKVVETRKQVLGPEDPATLEGAADLARNYIFKGRHRKAETMLIPVLDAQKRALGDSHPDTLRTMNDLAGVMQKLRRLNEAAQLYKQVLDARTRVLGKYHTDTLNSMHELASMISQLGRVNEAQQLYTQLLDAQKRVLWKEHPATLNTMHELARTMSRLGRLEEAERRFTQVLDARTRVLGDSHPRTLVTMRNLAYVYRRQGKEQDFKVTMAQADALETASAR
jgi:tetratricopeptide (TPR) repeat protein